MTDKTCRLSIIIPTYNVENYIEETLDSCLCQDIPKSEYEIICIDDGSSDNTVAKIQNYVSDNANIKLFTQQNSGVSATRNKGIELAQGNYIWFVDSDDLVAPNCIATILSKAEEYDAEKLLFGMERFENEPPTPKRTNHFEFCDQNDQLYKFTFSHGGGGVWRNFYKTEFLKCNNLYFNTKMAFSEDILFDFISITKCNRCLKTKNSFYFYRQRPNSALRSKNFDKHISSMHILAKEYSSISEKNTSAPWEKTAKNKSHFAVKALLFSLVQKGDVDAAKKYISILKEEKLYPYPFLNILFKNKSSHEYFINWISFFFPFEWYFMFCVRLSSLKKKILKK